MSIIRIPLGKDKFTIVDDQDRDLVLPFKWSASVRDNTTYVVGEVDGSRVYLHRHLLGAAKGQFVDHRNGDGTDNTRMNLRITTPKGNVANRGSVGGVSRFKGVHISNRKWTAQISTNGVRRHLGRFTSELEAAKAYDVAAYELHGEMAKPNLPNGFSGEVDRSPDDLAFSFDEGRAHIVRATRGLLSQNEFGRMLEVSRRSVMFWESRRCPVPDRVIDFCLNYAASPDEVAHIIVSRKRAGGKLSLADAEELRRLIRQGVPVVTVMEKFGVSRKYLWQVMRGEYHKAWAAREG